MTSCSLFLGLALWAKLQNDSVFVWAGGASLVASLTDYTSAVSQGLRKRQIVAWLSLAQPFVYLLGTVFLWQARLVTPTHLYAIFTMSFVPTFLLYLLSLRCSFIPSLEGRFLSWRYLHDAWKPLLAFFMIGILNYFYQAVGILALGQARQFEDAAYFNAALTLVTMPETLALVALTAVLYPDMVAAMAEGKRDNAASLFDAFLRGALVPLSLLTGIFMSHADVIIRLLYTDAYAASSIVLAIAAPLTLILFLQQILIFGLYALRKPGLASKGMAVQALITLVGSLFVTTKYIGNRATALAVMYTLACIAGFLIHWTDLKKLLSVQVTLSRILCFCFVSIGIVRISAKVVSLVSLETTLPALIMEIFIVIPLYVSSILIILLRPQERRRFISLLSR
ncbi:MAG: hypothetical protein H5T63_05915 [Chloroflexi bacterium]|nr:hypothetical protein [Chloroflexota bacterium]